MMGDTITNNISVMLTPIQLNSFTIHVEYTNMYIYIPNTPMWSAINCDNLICVAVHMFKYDFG